MLLGEHDRSVGRFAQLDSDQPIVWKRATNFEREIIKKSAFRRASKIAGDPVSDSKVVARSLFARHAGMQEDAVAKWTLPREAGKVA
jgi:hypothetical protein